MTATLSGVVCTACDSIDTTPDPFYYDWQGQRYDLYRCRTCTHQFVYPPITPQDQAIIYSNDYFKAGGDWVCGQFQGSYDEATECLRQEARSILAMLTVQQGRLLDVGCAGGVFLDEARTAGFEVMGLELNPTQAQQARTRFALEVVTGRIEDVATDWGRFQVVTLLDCLEHIPAPLAALRRIASWLNPGGILFIRGPLAASWTGQAKEALRRAVGVEKQLPGYPLDANHFNPRSLAACLAAAGFDYPRWVTRQSDFGNCYALRVLPGVDVRAV